MAGGARSLTVEGLSSRWMFYAAFTAIAVNNLAAALDATTLSQALPVSNNLGLYILTMHS